MEAEIFGCVVDKRQCQTQAARVDNQIVTGGPIIIIMESNGAIPVEPDGRHSVQASEETQQLRQFVSV
jgi:hypothetical protein